MSFGWEKYIELLLVGIINSLFTKTLRTDACAQGDRKCTHVAQVNPICSNAYKTEQLNRRMFHKAGSARVDQEQPCLWKSTSLE